MNGEDLYEMLPGRTKERIAAFRKKNAGMYKELIEKRKAAGFEKLKTYQANYQAAYRVANAEKLKNYQVDYQAANAEKLKAYQAAYRAKKNAS